VHHALRLSHLLISHHLPVRLVIAWVTSWVSAGRGLVVWLVASSLIRVHAHSFSIVWSIWPRTISTVAGSPTVVIRVMTVRGHGIESSRSVRTHEKVCPVASVVMVRRFVLASLSLLALLNVEVIIAPECMRRHEVSSVSLVEVTAIHRHAASGTGTTTELISSVRWGVIIPLGVTSPKSDPHSEVGLSSFLVSPLVSVFVILDRICLEVLPSRFLLIFATSRIGLVVFLPVPLLLVLVLWTFNIFFILFVLVGFWVVPTLFLLSFVTISILFLCFLFAFSWKCIVELFALWMGTALGFASFCFLRLPFLRRRACLLLFRQWFLVSWILIVQGVFRKSCIHSSDTPSRLDLVHALDPVFVADDFHRVDFVQLVKFADTSFDQFD